MYVSLQAGHPSLSWAQWWSGNCAGETEGCQGQLPQPEYTVRLLSDFGAAYQCRSVCVTVGVNSKYIYSIMCVHIHVCTVGRITGSPAAGEAGSYMFCTKWVSFHTLTIWISDHHMLVYMYSTQQGERMNVPHTKIPYTNKNFNTPTHVYLVCNPSIDERDWSNTTSKIVT